MTVYRNEKGTLTWAGSNGAYRRGDVVVEPPEHILEKFRDEFERLDDPETGTIDRELLEGLRYRTLQRIAASDAYDGVNGNAPKAKILETVGTDAGESADE
ncbi:hypothetical protein [Halostagnicola sp. A-GB9-2]|uniref:hypothetical protein n=1 Tax=Halostagnicola sp. A-GB9-2 TaxID=3048066 RepID=UPI0024C0CA1E|nr:hypothetical protein [Halostagnicola sp. A-GB9-2]MDJ1433589.1 hypothetical protein [Halostagnicola sp. A-GB9-2]